jgi:hypothetical protein
VLVLLAHALAAAPQSAGNSRCSCPRFAAAGPQTARAWAQVLSTLPLGATPGFAAAGPRTARAGVLPSPSGRCDASAASKLVATLAAATSQGCRAGSKAGGVTSGDNDSRTSRNETQVERMLPPHAQSVGRLIRLRISPHVVRRGKPPGGPTPCRGLCEPPTSFATNPKKKMRRTLRKVDLLQKGAQVVCLLLQYCSNKHSGTLSFCFSPQKPFSPKQKPKKEVDYFWKHRHSI